MTRNGIEQDDGSVIYPGHPRHPAYHKRRIDGGRSVILTPQGWSEDHSRRLDLLAQIEEQGKPLHPRARAELDDLRARWMESPFQDWDRRELGFLEKIEQKHGAEMNAIKQKKLARLRTHPECPLRGHA